MNKTVTFTLFAITASSAIAQQTHYSSPRGFLTIEGSAHADQFGGYANGRHMFFDGEQRGTVLALKEVAHRPNQTIYSVMTGLGRRWNNVTLRVSNCDMALASPTFDKNPTSTPTLVFTGAVSWPDRKGLPASNPATWGGAGNSHSFPFASTWVYTGQADMCLDYDFNGGALANNAAWPTSKLQPYHLDGYDNVTHASGQPSYLGKGGALGGCIDSSTPKQLGAYTYLDCKAYGPTYQIARLRGMLEVYSRSYYTAPGKAVVHALSFGGSTAGVAFPGTTCNRLHVDVTRPTIYSFKTADTSSAAYTYNGMGLFAYQPATAGVPMWCQAAWDDSSTQRVQLSRAVRNSIPALPKLVMRRVLFQNDPAKKGGTGYGPYDYSSHNPLVRYGQ